MIDDYTLIEHRFETDVNIVPVADVHLGAIEHDTRAWEEFIQKTLTAPDTYLILCGDLMKKMLLPSESSRPQVLICRNDRDNKRIDVAW